VEASLLANSFDYHRGAYGFLSLFHPREVIQVTELRNCNNPLKLEGKQAILCCASHLRPVSNLPKTDCNSHDLRKCGPDAKLFQYDLYRLANSFLPEEEILPPSSAINHTHRPGDVCRESLFHPKQKGLK
jgi:hypothetical protein